MFFSSRLGPLVRHWTMRFEAKHQYFKQLASRMGNFINVTWSLAVRHQCYQCYVLSSDSGFCEVQQDIGKGIYIQSYIRLSVYTASLTLIHSIVMLSGHMFTYLQVLLSSLRRQNSRIVFYHTPREAKFLGNYPTIY